ncbi:manganese efflux pump [Paenibacillus sp. HN-1]|uniref:manganese efflux pump MntP n=1 Tax=Paenibacillus TaxID=44249 RepID=UPI001CA9BFCE|nr:MULTISPECIES: manganese efflux pump MntP family protein [Paenibacillus]MBY9077657.1 manganese efflux pump [Paenibacillus sp. CGMCC 1.18879]MBY9087418.1 manganese efflux pump [Paenibacillus sinensis]
MGVAEVQTGAGQILTIAIMAFALGLDAFSLGVGIGMKGIRLLHVLQMSLLVAFFHVLMPLLGLVTGNYVGHLLGRVSGVAAGGLLVALGVHMVINSFRTADNAEMRGFDHRTLWGMLLISLSVSIDSFSVGVSLGVFVSHVLLTVLAFGACGGMMSISGLLLGRRVSRGMGEYGEAVGGAILLGFGLLFIF